MANNIHSLHINVGNGDSAIHLLVQEGTGGDGAKPQVKNAILVDGGKATAVTQIRRTMDFIKSTYDLSAQEHVTTTQGGHNLRFDGIVVTRWAVDHSGGVIQLILDDLQAASTATTPAQQSSFMKYDAATPLTTFYAPYWAGTGASLLPSKKRKTPPTARMKVRAPAQAFAAADVLPGDPNFKLDDTGRTVDFSLGTEKWESICKLVATPRELIGRELFTGAIKDRDAAVADSTTSSLARSYSDREDLVNSIPAVSGFGVFCIGADGQIISSAESQTVTDTFNLDASSIVLVAVVSGAVKHYFAGDLDYQREKIAVTWINQKDPQLPLVKLSNHGSVISAIPDFLDKVKPKNFICSAGPSTQYLHPRWEVLLLLQAWRDSLAKAAGADLPVDPFIHLTNFPVYLASNDPPGTNSPIKINTTDVFTVAMALYDGQSLLDDFNKADNKTDWVISNIYSSWNRLSYNLAEQFPLVGASAKGSSVTSKSQLLFVQAKLADAGFEISYVNGGWKTVATSGQRDPHVTHTFTPYHDPETQPLSVKKTNVEKVDTGPGVVILPTGMKLPSRAPPTGGPVDKDDENPSANMVDAAKTIFVASTGTHTDSTTTQGATAKVYLLSSSFYQPLSVTPPAGEYTLAGPLSGFIASTSIGGFVGLQADLPTGDLDYNIPVDAHDRWGFYMAADILKASITLKMGTPVTGDPTTTKRIGGVKMGTQFGNWGLEFSDQYNQAQFGPDFTGLVIDGLDVVVAGLNPDTQETKPNLKDVAAAFDLTARPGKLSDFVKVLTHGDGFNVVLVARPSATVSPSAIWCFPGDVYKFTIRLTFQNDVGGTINNAKTQLNTYLQSIFGQKVQSPDFPTIPNLGFTLSEIFTFEVKMTAEFYPANDGGFQVRTESAMTVSTGVTVNSVGYDLAVTLTDAGVELDLTVTPGDNSAVTAAAGLAGFSQNGSDLVSSSNMPSVLGGAVELRNVSLGLQKGGMSYGVDFLVNFSAGNVSDVPIVVSFSYPPGRFNASLVASTSLSGASLLPSYESRKDARLAAPTTGVLKLSDMFGITVPSELPDAITQASIEFTKGETSTFTISGEIAVPQPTPGSTDPVPAVQFTDFSVSLAGEKTGGNLKVTADLATTVQLTPATSDYTTATITGSLHYVHDSGDSNANVWEFSGHVDSLQVGTIASHFDADSQDAVMSLIGKLEIKYLDLFYSYHPKDTTATQPSTSSFVIAGDVVLGELELILYYQYLSFVPSAGDDPPKNATTNHPPADTSIKTLEPPTNGVSWRFDARLGASGQSSTIGSIVTSILGSVPLPGFVADTPVAPPDSDKPPVILTMQRSSQNDGLVFVAWIELGSISLTFTQLAPKKDATAAGGGGGTPAAKPATPKRLLRISLDKLPTVTGIPIVGELPQPFDDLEYVWVQDTDGNAGFTADEIGELNTLLDADGLPEVKFKETNTQPNTTAPPPIAMAAGHHFIVVHDKKVVLDYVFKTKTKDPEVQPGGEQTQALVSGNAAAPAAAPAASAASTAPAAPAAGDDGTSENNVQKGALGKTIGPLKIDNVGLQFKDGILWVMLDATVTLGSGGSALSFSLLGFGIGAEIANFHLNDWSSLKDTIKFQLHGMALDVEKAPMMLSGIFEYEKTDTQVSYRGGVGLTFPPYAFVAVGEYDETTLPSGDKYKSIFVFARLDGPLVTLEFATISGVRVGFGYNSAVKPPSLEELTDFPFLKDTDITPDGTVQVPGPKQILDKIRASGYVYVQEGSVWVAAGMKVIAFDIMSISAVALLAFTDAGADISIFANSIVQMPPDVTNRNEMLLYVEIDMVAELNTISGYIRIEAALAPTSFLLVPECHLYGGMALVYWFNPNTNAGDWVFSIGGYHPVYRPPPYYPVPKRLGISFQLADNLSVTGEAYFAITPQCVMGGGRLHIQLDVGPISAYLDAWADFLINYKPFHYIGDIGVVVGVSFNLDVLFIHIHISAHVGASLHIEGPDFGGVAHVDFYICGFDIRFGGSPPTPDALTLEKFYELVKQSETKQIESGSSGTPVQAELVVTLEDGNYAAKATPRDPKDVPNTGSGAKWFVRAGTFRFRISCHFPISQASLNGSVIAPDPKQAPIDNIHSRPMRVPDTTKISSVLSADITIANDTTAPALPNFRPVYITKTLPNALWAPYTTTTDPIQRPNPAVMLAADPAATTELAMAISVQAPLPILSTDRIPDFDAVAAMRANVFGEEVDDPKIPPSGNAQSLWIPKDVEVAVGATALDQWNKVADAWNNPKEEKAVLENMLTLCEHALGWDNPPPEIALAPEFGLKAGKPKLLLDGFTNLYLAPPKVASAA